MRISDIVGPGYLLYPVMLMIVRFCSSRSCTHYGRGIGTVSDLARWFVIVCGVPSSWRTSWGSLGLSSPSGAVLSFC